VIPESLVVEYVFAFCSNSTAIHVAIIQEHWDVALLLLDVPEIDLEAEDDDGDTPILRACMSGNLPLFRKLASMGANLLHRNGKGQTALHRICTSPPVGSMVEIARELIQFSSSLMYHVDNNGHTPLDWAVERNMTTVVELLLSAYRDQVMLQHGNLSLHFILQQRRQQQQQQQQRLRQEHQSRLRTEFFLGNLSRSIIRQQRQQQQEQQQQQQHQSLFNTELGSLFVEEFRALLQLFPPTLPQTRDSRGRLPLHIAAADGVAVEFLEILMFRDACRVPDNTGAVPIHHACRTSASLDVIRFLAETGGVATIQKRDLEGCLPLHLLIKEGAPRLEVIKYLVNFHSASLSVRTMDGDLPLTLAGASSSLDVINYVLRQNPDFIKFPEKAAEARVAANDPPSRQDIDAALGMLRRQMEQFNTSEDAMRALELLEQRVPRLPRQLKRSKPKPASQHSSLPLLPKLETLISIAPGTFFIFIIIIIIIIIYMFTH